MNWVHSDIAAKILSFRQELVALCLAKIATAWMVDPNQPDRLVTSKNLGADEISAVTGAFVELGMWPNENGEFEYEERSPKVIQESLDFLT